ncbi:hypothetical protein TPA0907_40890 [Micromonospora humidisoli]|nr:hypothetical protein [Micromonospora sp. AKA109]GHJ09722.1 hypothetical protein TPA0907_40890 [Micromonospora sp. AKA109]
MVFTRVGVIAPLLFGAVAYATVGPDHDRAEPAPSATVTPTGDRGR